MAFESLERNADTLSKAIAEVPSPNRLETVRQVLEDIVLSSIRVKSHVVSADEREGGLRNLLNFGHSIGHAFEGILAPQILHGECVAIGMVLEAALSRYLGILKAPALARLTKCIAAYGLPLSYKDPIVQQRSGRKLCRVKDLMVMMGSDKKNVGHQKRVVLLAGIGRTHEPKATPVDDRHIRIFMSTAIEIMPTPISTIARTCTPPGSKSISNRALILAALAQGECRIKNLLHSDDTQVMLNALTELRCASFHWEDDGETLVVKGHGGQMHASGQELYLGNAGTASRFLTTVATLARPGKVHHSVLTGNQRMKLRPIGPLVDALIANGAAVKYLEKEGCLPLHIGASAGFEGGDIELAATVSSQYVSSILMCAPYAKKPVTLRLVGGKPISQPYIEMTAAMMASFGIKVTRSETEEHTYHIQCGTYRNPAEYAIESDASSATYPLAVAAITGSTCTIPNIGKASLQGDARFAVDVLRPMGCSVEQSATSTTVTGPAIGTLKPLKHVDMEPMTDAFLTAAVLAAVAQGSGRQHTTQITGIANQRVKECNRIKAMKDELAKFGVTCRELEDGIEVDGRPFSTLHRPLHGVHCYDDHRVAMSFSVLSLILPEPTVILERECVGKTWPAWWDELHQNFDTRLEGYDIDAILADKQRSKVPQRSLFLIGMRGAGKSTAGAWAANLLGWPFIDLDTELEKQLGTSIPDLIKAKGWDGFRQLELKLLQDCITHKAERHIFACGGGVVETPMARELLIKYHRSGGSVLYVHRSLQNIIDYLSIDKTRPAYTDDIKAVWDRREPWYEACSNYEYFSRTEGTGSLTGPFKDYLRLMSSITGRNSPLERIRAKPYSFFLAVTVSDVSTIVDKLPEMAVGSDAVELRVDLLRDQNSDEELVTTTYVGNQVALLRATLDLPIIFTIRSVSQAGKFPDHETKHMMQLYRLALRMGVEFLDIEMRLPDDLLRVLVANKGQTKLIASHHDPRAELCWDDGSWVTWYNKALQYGDIVKLVGVATNRKDNADLEEFRDWATSAHKDTPLIAINMHRHGQRSRIDNPFLTPVTHPLLTTKAAPGQLSAAEIRQALSINGDIAPLDFYLFGKPTSLSKSPKLHNTFFKQAGLPHHYQRFETDDVHALEGLLADPAFGGASVTIPLKIDIQSYLDEMSADANLIGAVNTIVVDHTRPSGSGKGFYKIGYNTDWQGIQLLLENSGASAHNNCHDQREAGLVIGSGGTARAACHALHTVGFSPIYVLGRTKTKVQEMIASFPPEYHLVALSSVNDVDTSAKRPRAAIGTVPADLPIDNAVQAALDVLMDSHKTEVRYLLSQVSTPIVKCSD